jgi:hypothetical protein
MSAMYLAIVIIKNGKLKYKNFIFLGIILACAILNRADNIILSLVIIPTLFILIKEQALKKMGAFMCLIIILVILLFPYMSYLHKHTGTWTLTTKITNLKYYEYMGFRDSLARQKRPLIRFSEFKPFEYIRKHKKKLLQRYARGLLLSFRKLRTILYFGFGYILIGLGFWRGWSNDRKRTEVLLFSCLSPLVIIPLGNVLQRYFLFALPIFLLWIAHGLENLGIFIKNSFTISDRRTKSILYLVLLLLVLSSARYSFPQETGIRISSFPQYQQMGSWIKGNIKDIENKKIASREPYTAFYSGGTWVYLPFINNHRDLIEYSKKRKANYIVIESVWNPPPLSALLNYQKKHTGLAKVYVVEKPKKIILYKLK